MLYLGNKRDSSQDILKKYSFGDDYAPLNLITYYKARKNVNSRSIIRPERGRIESPETVKCIQESMILDSGGIKSEEESMGSSVHGSGTIGYPYGKK